MLSGSGVSVVTGSGVNVVTGSGVSVVKFRFRCECCQVQV